MKNTAVRYFIGLLAIGSVVRLLQGFGLLNGKAIAIILMGAFVVYLIYLFGYSVGNKDGLSGKNKHPEDDERHF